MTPADKVIKVFGGIRPTAREVGVPVSTVQGWLKRGNIHTRNIRTIIKAAKRVGVVVTVDELVA